jgi:twinkle protein
MGKLGGLVKELNIMGDRRREHLTTPEGKPHEEGGRVTIRHFKGSRAIGFWSHFMFGLERNQQSEDEAERSTTTFRILKDRNTGNSTGQVFYLGYDRDNGRLHETEKPEEGRSHGFRDETGEVFDEMPF